MTDFTSWHRTDTQPLTVADIIGEPTVRTDWIARQRTEALVRERNRRVDAQDALRRLLTAMEAHRRSVPPRNARKADKALWDVLDAIGGEDG